MGVRFGGGRDLTELRQAARTERLDWPLLGRAAGFFRPYRWRVAAVLALLLVSSALGVAPAVLTQRIVDDGILKGRLDVVLQGAGAIVGLALVQGLLGVGQTYLTNHIGQSVMADVRARLYRHLLRQPLPFFASAKSGELVSRLTADVSAIQSVVTNTVVGLAQNLFILATTLAVMFGASWRLSLLAVLVLPAFVLPTQRTGERRRDLQAEVQAVLGRLTAQLVETLGVSGALLVKLFGREADEAERFEAGARQLARLQIRQSLVGRFLFMWLNIFATVGPALLWGYGGYLAIRGLLSVGTVVAFTTLVGRLYTPLAQMAQLHVDVLTSVALFRRIFALLDLDPGRIAGSGTLPPPPASLGIAFEAVTFVYPGARQPALDGVSLAVPAGQTVALVGPSGAGKTTLMQLVPRLLEPTSGVVRVGGVDVRTIDPATLRREMGMVPQDPFLFHDTILANLRYAKPDASAREIEEACRAAEIHDVIMAMPDGYETVVGERGYRLSGGEKQRLAIARVLLRAPRIVLLDEATSSLDAIAERRIQAALAALLAGRTALVIAHRLSTVLAANLIAVLERGRLVAVGPHAELLAAGGLYARLYREQFHGTA
jgi:ATP-binding cassette subfamily B protein